MIGDKYDSVKWDFDESDIPVYIIDGYLYKARSHESAIILHRYRNLIDELCFRIMNNENRWKGDTQLKNKVLLFLDIHKQRSPDTTKYLLSEIPIGTIFSGLNKPKMRYIDNTLPSIGKDKKGRAAYRDIFLDLGHPNLTDLLIHELSHTMANHIAYRDNDHNSDFIEAEEFIKKYWPN